MNRRIIVYGPVVLLASVLMLWGCPKKAEVTAAPEAAPAAQPAQEKPATAATPTTKEEQPKATMEEQAAPEAGLQPIYFDFDRSFIRSDARPVMKANADWLKAHPTAKIKIEGNCDERGTIEYNQALGQRRATSAKKYLTDLGISSGRISLISYGKEKPICTEHNEDCWQKNRRDDLVVVTE